MSTNKVIFINSEDKKSNETHSNFTVELNNTQDYRGRHFMSLHSATIPVSYYTFPLSENGQLISHTIKVNFDTSGTSQFIFQFTPSNSNGGSPNAQQFATQLKTYLDNCAVSVGSANVWDVTYDTVLGKYKFELTAGFEPYNFDFTDSGLTPVSGTVRATTKYLATAMGFDTNTIVPAVESSSILYSPNVADLGGTRTLRVLVQGAGLEGVYDYPKGKGSILGTIQVTENSFGVINYENGGEEHSRRISTNVNSQLNIRLLDDLDNEVDLNGQSWRLTILLQN